MYLCIHVALHYIYKFSSLGPGQFLANSNIVKTKSKSQCKSQGTTSDELYFQWSLSNVP